MLTSLVGAALAECRKSHQSRFSRCPSLVKPVHSSLHHVVIPLHIPSSIHTTSEPACRPVTTDQPAIFDRPDELVPFPVRPVLHPRADREHVCGCITAGHRCHVERTDSGRLVIAYLCTDITVIAQLHQAAHPSQSVRTTSFCRSLKLVAFHPWFSRAGHDYAVLPVKCATSDHQAVFFIVVPATWTISG